MNSRRQLHRCALLGAALAVLVAGVDAQAGGPVLPTVAKTKAAQKARDKRVAKHRRRFLQKRRQSKSKNRSGKKVLARRALANRIREVNAALKNVPPGKPVLIVLAGPNGAGKTSLIRRVLQPLFAGNRDVDAAHFGAPPEGSDAAEQILRFVEKVPTRGRVMIWDRSWYDSAFYSPDGTLRPSKKAAKGAINDVRHVEAVLKGKVHVIKIYLDATPGRQAKTIAKREIEGADRLSESDYVGYGERKQFGALADHVRDRTEKSFPWHVVKVKASRTPARQEVVEILSSELLGD